MKKFLIGSEGTNHWFLETNVDSISNGTYPRNMISTDSTGIYVTGQMSSSLSSVDFPIAKVNKYGTVEWSTSLTKSVTSSPDVGRMRGNAVASNGTYTIAVGEEEDENITDDYYGIIFCVDNATGTVQWQRRYASGRAFSISMEEGDSTAYVGCWLDATTFANVLYVTASSGTSSTSGHKRLGLSQRVGHIKLGTSSVWASTNGTSSNSFKLYKLSGSLEVSDDREYSSNASSSSTSTGDFVVDSSDNLYTAFLASDSEGIVISKIDSSMSETWQRLAVKDTGLGFDTLSGGTVFLDSDNNLFVAFNNTTESETVILKMDTSGNLVDQIAIQYSSGSFNPIVMRDFDGDLILKGISAGIMKYPKDFSKTGTFGNLTVSDTTDYSISATTLTGTDNGITGSTAVTYSIGTSSYTEEDTSSEVSNTRSDI